MKHERNSVGSYRDISIETSIIDIDISKLLCSTLHWLLRATICVGSEGVRAYNRAML